MTTEPDGATEPPIRRLASATVHRSRWMTVRVDDVEFADGSTGTWDVLHKGDFALIVPVHDDGRLELVRQYRYPPQAWSLEFPQGMIEPGEDHLAAAARELEEETGWRAASMRPIGRFMQAVGFSDQFCAVYLATGLEAGDRSLETGELGMTSRTVTEAAFLAAVASGEIADSSTLAAWSMVLADRAT